MTPADLTLREFLLMWWDICTFAVGFWAVVTLLRAAWRVWRNR